jgi:hypothetical protein
MCHGVDSIVLYPSKCYCLFVSLSLSSIDLIDREWPARILIQDHSFPRHVVLSRTRLPYNCPSPPPSASGQRTPSFPLSMLAVFPDQKKRAVGFSYATKSCSHDSVVTAGPRIRRRVVVRQETSLTPGVIANRCMVAKNSRQARVLLLSPPLSFFSSVIHSSSSHDEPVTARAAGDVLFLAAGRTTRT